MELAAKQGTQTTYDNTFSLVIGSVSLAVKRSPDIAANNSGLWRKLDGGSLEKVVHA